MTAEKRKIICRNTLSLLWFWAVTALLCCPGNLQAQTIRGLSMLDLERDVTHAEALLRSFKNDSAGILAANAIAKLKSQNILDTPLGRRALLAEATALERDEQDELAIEKLLYLKELSRHTTPRDIFARSAIVLACLYEKNEQKSACLENLKEAKSVIAQDKLDSIYPFFAVRMASYQRFFGNKDTAIYYAQEALQKASELDCRVDKAPAHLLLGILLRGTSLQKELYHFRSALKLCNEHEIRCT